MEKNIANRPGFFGSIVLTLLLTGLIMAQPNTAAIVDAERTWAKAVVENDFETLERVLADDLYYSHSNFLEDTKRSYIDKLKSGEARYYVLDIESTKVQLVDEKTALAMSVAVYETKGTDGERHKATLKTLHVFRKNDGHWQLTAHQSARKPE
jgi:ketosteroid isomerase-like protein